MTLLALMLLLSAWIWAKLAADGARVPVFDKQSVQLGQHLPYQALSNAVRIKPCWTGLLSSTVKKVTGGLISVASFHAEACCCCQI